MDKKAEEILEYDVLSVIKDHEGSTLTMKKLVGSVRARRTPRAWKCSIGSCYLHYRPSVRDVACCIERLIERKRIVSSKRSFPRGRGHWMLSPTYALFLTTDGAFRLQELADQHFPAKEAA